MNSVVLAVDLGGTKVSVALVDSLGRIDRRLTAPVDTSSAEAPIEQVIALAGELRRNSLSPVALAVAVPGLARPNGTVWAPNLPGWEAMPLAERLGDGLHVPVFVESDRNAVVLGESWLGAGRGRADVIVLILGTGIGAGILSGGRIVRGAHELSGCAGWLVVSNDRPEAARRCGTLEALAAGPAVARASGRESAEEAAAAARRGEARAIAAFAQAGRVLGLAVANLISLFDPEVVVLTGGLSAASDLFLDELKRTAADRAQPLSARGVEITVSTLGGDANLLGAARLAFESDGVGRASQAGVKGQPSGRHFDKDTDS